MATTFDLSVIFKAVDKLSGPMTKMSANLKSFSDRTKKIGKSLSDIGGKLTMGLTLPIVAAGTMAVKSYVEQEEAVARLKQAIKSTGKEFKININNLTGFADELQKVTTFEDDVTIKAMAMLQQMGNLNEDGIKKLMPSIMDFSTAMGVDLETAAKLFGKSIGTTNNALSRYGIDIKASMTKSEAMAYVIDQVQKKMGGMSKAVGLTAAGQFAIFKNSVGELAESFGKILLPFIIKVVHKLQKLIEWFGSLSEGSKKVILVILAIVAVIGPLISAIGALGTAISAITAIMAINPVIAIIIGVLIALMAIITAIIVVVKNWKKISAWFVKTFENIKKAVGKLPNALLYLIAVIIPFIGIPLLIIKNWDRLIGFFKRVLPAVKTFFIGIKDAAGTIFSKIGSFFVDLWGGMISGVQGFVDTILIIFAPVIDKIKVLWQPVADFFNKMWESISGIAGKIAGSSAFKFLFGSNEEIDKAAQNGKSVIEVKVSADGNSTAVIDKVKSQGANVKATSNSAYNGRVIQ